MRFQGHQFAGAAIDSRQMEEDLLFFALLGERVDGHDFLEEVAKKGRYAVVQEGYSGPDFGLKLFPVPSPLMALQETAQELVATSGAQVIAVTGSVGKTTTKEFLATILQERFRILASWGNQNSQAGLPMSILRARGDEEVFVLEMAMSWAGQIGRLVEIAPPDVALVTAIDSMNGEFFNSIEEIAKAKGEIFSSPRTWIGLQPKGMPECGPCRKLTLGEDYRIEGTTLFEGQEMAMELCWDLPGKHNRENFVAAAAAARQMGLSWEEIERAVPKLTLVNQRFEVVEKKGITIVNDTYNAGKASMCAALENMPEPKGEGRRIAILGSMAELGKFSTEAHRAVAEKAKEKVDHLFCFGEGAAVMPDVWPEARWFASRDEVERAVKEVMREGDVLLIKGSRGYALEELVEELLS